MTINSTFFKKIYVLNHIYFTSYIIIYLNIVFLFQTILVYAIF